MDVTVAGAGTVPVARARFTAMGTDAEVQVVDGPAAVVEEARARIEHLEALWSRFRPTSEVSQLNDRAGEWVAVAPETLVLLDRAVAGARATDGRFDPTVGAAVIAHGYDRTFAEVRERGLDHEPEPIVDGAWPMIEIDVAGGRARLPVGTRIDAGAIGKGLAADLVTAALAGESAGLLVNLGGDLRAVGRAADDAGWVITVDDPLHEGRELARLAIPEGGVATSSTQRRRWSTPAGEVHHVFDPRTGRPAATTVAAVTVVAAEAWWAEVQATSLVLEPDLIDDLDAGDGSVEALLVLVDGSTWATSALREVVA
ncbi:MAG: FAD:protein FMN transferase [Acidimicrobiales bacterium]